MNNFKERIKKPALILAWSLYDLANQFFAINIVSLYFILWVTMEKAAPEKFYSMFFAGSMFIVALLVPVLGTISDITRKRRIFLAYFTLISVVFTVLLGLCSNVFLALAFFAIANVGCQGAVIFYNAMIVSVAPKERIGLVSGLGKMMGYAGAIIALYLLRPIVETHGYQAAFIPTGILFLIFSIPCIVFVKDVNPRFDISFSSFLTKNNIAGIFKRLKEIFIDSSRFPGLVNFLKAGFLGLCAVQVMIVFMSVYAKKVLALDDSQIVNLIMFSTVFAMAGSIIAGYISDRIGHLRSLVVIFIFWGLAFTLAAFLNIERFYWAIGALVGLSLGPTWVLSRAMVVKLVPAERLAELFAIFIIIGNLSAGVGTLFWGTALWVLSPLGIFGYRIALFSLNIFIVGGLIFLLRMGKEIGYGKKSRI